MKVEEIRALSDQDIAEEIEKHHEEWRNLRFQNALGRLTGFHQLREVRRAIARLKTVQTEREIAKDPLAHFVGNDRRRARRRVAKQEHRRLARQRAGQRHRKPRTR